MIYRRNIVITTLYRRHRAITFPCNLCKVTFLSGIFTRIIIIIYIYKVYKSYYNHAFSCFLRFLKAKHLILYILKLIHNFNSATYYGIILILYIEIASREKLISKSRNCYLLSFKVLVCRSLDEKDILLVAYR